MDVKTPAVASYIRIPEVLTLGRWFLPAETLLTKVTLDATTPSRPLINRVLSAAAKHIVAGFAIAAAAMHPEICAAMLSEPDESDPAREPPSAPGP